MVRSVICRLTLPCRSSRFRPSSVPIHTSPSRSAKALTVLLDNPESTALMRVNAVGVADIGPCAEPSHTAPSVDFSADFISEFALSMASPPAGLRDLSPNVYTNRPREVPIQKQPGDSSSTLRTRLLVSEGCVAGPSLSSVVRVAGSTTTMP